MNSRGFLSAHSLPVGLPPLAENTARIREATARDGERSPAERQDRRQRAEAWARRVGWRPNNCLANYYSDGTATMGFHADSTDELEPGTGVAVVSLGAERSITFRSADRSVVVEYPLRSGSLLSMTAELQADWKHAILPRPGAGGRISLTFRRLKVA